MLSIKENSFVLRTMVRSILAAAAVVSVLLLSLNYILKISILPSVSICIGTIAVLLFWADVTGRLEVKRRIPLFLIFMHCTACALFYGYDPAPIYALLPSFLCSIIVLHRKKYIRLSAILHLVVTVVCYLKGGGEVQKNLAIELIFIGTLITIFASSFLAEISNRRYFYKTKKVQSLLELKSLDNKLKSDILRHRNELLRKSLLRLQKEIHDNAERMRSLAAVNEELDLIAKAASRDIKAPLVLITEQIEQLGQCLDGLEVEDDFFDYVNFISDGAFRMNAMVDDLLHYCDPGKEQKQSKVSTKEVLLEIESNLTNLLVRENAKLFVEEDMPAILGHRTEVLQLFQNLISNGIKFRKPNHTPECRIGFSRTKDEICFYVKDNGIGIPPNRINDVFGLFTRLHNRDSYEGTGIGLALCRRIVIGAGGEIWAESTEGEGTTFLFTWPIAKKQIVEVPSKRSEIRKQYQFS